MERRQHIRMKGTILDIPFILIALSVSIMMIIIVFIVLTGFSDAWTATGESRTILDAGIASITVFDYMVAFFAVGISMFSVISAFFVKSHPVFFIFSMILLAVVILFSAVMTNVVDAFLTSPLISTAANSFPITVTLVRNFPLFSLLIGITIAIVMHSKGEDSPGGGI